MFQHKAPERRHRHRCLQEGKNIILTHHIERQGSQTAMMCVDKGDENSSIDLFFIRDEKDSEYGQRQALQTRCLGKEGRTLARSSSGIFNRNDLKLEPKASHPGTRKSTVDLLKYRCSCPRISICNVLNKRSWPINSKILSLAASGGIHFFGVGRGSLAIRFCVDDFACKRCPGLNMRVRRRDATSGSLMVT